MTEKLNKLMVACAGGLSIQINPHREEHITPRQYIRQEERTMETYEIPLDVLIKMNEMDSLVVMRLYAFSTNGFYVIHHYDLETAIDNALACIEQA